MLATPREMTPPLAPRVPPMAPLSARGPGSGGSGAGMSALRTASLGLAGGSLTQRGPRTKVDTAPNVPVAGKSLGQGSDPVILPTPRTPEHMLSGPRAAHRQRTGAGEMTIHWGLKHAPRPEVSGGYGRKSDRGEDVSQNFKAGQRLGSEEYKASVGEAIYQSTAREPLGRGYTRGHKLPIKTLDKEFRFGHLPDATHESSKLSIFPRDVEPTSARAKEMYRRTHGSTESGEMLKRDYNYPAAVKESRHKFGMMDCKDSNNDGLGVKTALTQEAGKDLNSHRATNIVDGTLAHFREVSRDHLGTSRSLLQGGGRPTPRGHTFGKPSGGQETSAGAVMRGWYGAEEQQPDRDLGKCTVHGKRNVLTQVPFGVPSVRSDLAAVPREKRSLMCSTHYGDDDQAQNLLYPGKFQAKGVNDEDFFLRRPKEELMDIFGSFHQVDAETFDTLFAQAQDLHGDAAPVASLEAMMVAFGERAAARAC